LLTSSRTSKPRVFWIARKPENSFVLDRGLLDGALDTRVGGKFSIGNTVANAGMYDHILSLVSPKRSFDRPHAYAQVPSHRSASVERLRLHIQGMVGSPGWLDGFPEVGGSRGPWRGRWAKDLLDASATGENNSLRHGAACQRLCKSRNRAATQPSL